MPAKAQSGKWRVRMSFSSRVIGIAGTAKNTGKTTATNFILKEMHKRKLTPALTSIGYDGERLDNVTGLPKPRVPVVPGTLVAVAHRCLPVSTAQVEVIEETGISTPLGPVVLGIIKKAGQMVVAGPNKSSSLRVILDKLTVYKPHLILVDGALNRIAPMVETQGFILATGASRSSDITRLAYEAHSLDYLFRLPLYQGDWYNYITLVGGDQISFDFSSVFTRSQVDRIIAKFSPAVEKIIIPGVVREELWKELAGVISAQGAGVTIAVADPIKLALGGSVGNLHRLFEGLGERGVAIKVKRPLPLLAISVNPFYPKYRFEANDYHPAYVDAERLHKAVARAVTVPVADVMRNGGLLLEALGIKE